MNKRKPCQELTSFLHYSQITKQWPSSYLILLFHAWRNVQYCILSDIIDGCSQITMREQYLSATWIEEAEKWVSTEGSFCDVNPQELKSVLLSKSNEMAEQYMANHFIDDKQYSYAALQKYCLYECEIKQAHAMLSSEIFPNMSIKVLVNYLQKNPMIYCFEQERQRKILTGAIYLIKFITCVEPIDHMYQSFIQIHGRIEESESERRDDDSYFHLGTVLSGRISQAGITFDVNTNIVLRCDMRWICRNLLNPSDQQIKLGAKCASCSQPAEYAESFQPSGKFCHKHKTLTMERVEPYNIPLFLGNRMKQYVKLKITPTDGVTPSRGFIDSGGKHFYSESSDRADIDFVSLFFQGALQLCLNICCRARTAESCTFNVYSMITFVQLITKHYQIYEDDKRGQISPLIDNFVPVTALADLVLDYLVC